MGQLLGSQLYQVGLGVLVSTVLGYMLMLQQSGK